MMIMQGMLVGLMFKIRLCVYDLFMYCTIFVLLVLDHNQAGVFPEPELVKTIMVLESGNKCEFISSLHRQYTDLLCLGPTHGGKAIALQISKLGLPTRESQILKSHVWRFILVTHVCDPEKLDFLFEKIIRLGMKLLKLEVDESLVRLPDHLRIGRRDYSGDEDQASSLPDEILLPSEDLFGELSAAPADCFEGKSIQEMKAARLAIIKSIMEKSISQTDATKLEKQFSQLRSIDAVLKDRVCPKRKPKPHAVTAKFAAECFWHLYEKIPRWCLSLRYKGYTHGLQASVCSESLFSSIDRHLHPKGSFRSQSDVEVFFHKVNEWAQGLSERAYSANLKKQWNAPGIFTDGELSFMSEILNNGAIESILKSAKVANMCITFSGIPVPINQICNTMLKKVRLLADCLGFNTDDISFHRAEALQRDSWSSTGKEDNLLKATRMVNADVTRSVIAVYTPRSGGLPEFSFLSRSTFESFVMSCTCQVQTGAGSACACQLAWILRRKHRSIENIIWLSHPKFIRGYQESSSVYLSRNSQCDLQDEYKERWCSHPTYSEGLNGLTGSSDHDEASGLQEEMREAQGSGESDSIVVQSSSQNLIHSTQCFGISSLNESSHGQLDGSLDLRQDGPLHNGSLHNLSNGSLQGNRMMDAFSQVTGNQRVQYRFLSNPSSFSSGNCLLSGRSVSSDGNQEVMMHMGSMQNLLSSSNTLAPRTVRPVVVQSSPQNLLFSGGVHSSQCFGISSLNDSAHVQLDGLMDSRQNGPMHGGSLQNLSSMLAWNGHLQGNRMMDAFSQVNQRVQYQFPSNPSSFSPGNFLHSGRSVSSDGNREVMMHGGSMQNLSSSSNTLSSMIMQQPLLRRGDQSIDCLIPLSVNSTSLSQYCHRLPLSPAARAPPDDRAVECSRLPTGWPVCPDSGRNALFNFDYQQVAGSWTSLP